MIATIAALARNGIIGRNGSLPWSFPGDLAHFKQVTMGHIVIMGRKTFESITVPLVGRKIYVLSKDNYFKQNGCNYNLICEDYIYNNLYSKDIIFIAGGQSLYFQFAGLSREMYLTHIDREYPGDAAFPVGILNDFVPVSRETRIENDTTYQYVKYIKPFSVY